MSISAKSFSWLKRLIFLLIITLSNMTISAANSQLPVIPEDSDIDSITSQYDNSLPIIIHSEEASSLELLAVREIRRYVYLRTGKLLPIFKSCNSLPADRSLIIVGQKDRGHIKKLIGEHKNIKHQVDSLAEQEYALKTIESANQKIYLIAGGNPAGVLYGAYHFIEKLGVRFYLHGDVIPDVQIELNLPSVDEIGKPIFSLRGIHPFHNFPVGPTLWDRDNYLAVITQLPKLRMNFIGFHTYSKALPWRKYPAPELWWGLKEDINPDGTVKYSSGSSHDQHTLSGMQANGTDRYSFGASQLFTENLYGSDLYQDFMPTPKTDMQKNEVYNRSGEFLCEAFSYANSLGIKTCIGNELKMPLPDRIISKLKAQGKNPEDQEVVEELYEGIFERIKRTHPLDYYWLWTNETWTWKRIPENVVDATIVELKSAMAAAEKVGAPFTLGTSGWVLGPVQDRSLFDKVLKPDMFVSCISRNLGRSPIDSDFTNVQNRPKWAIPWLEDDQAMNLPQLHVERMMKDAIDARAYGCTGLFGIHWRTRILGPNISALAQVGWNQDYSNTLLAKEAEKNEPVKVSGGKVTRFNTKMKNTNLQPIFQSLRYGNMHYEIPVPNREYRITLQMVEPAYNESNRSFSVEIEGKSVLNKFDIFAVAGANTAVEQKFERIKVSDGVLDIIFTSHVDNACIAGIVIEEHDEELGPDAQPFLQLINCGGNAFQNYITDLKGKDKQNRHVDTTDFYTDWATTQFGTEAANEIASLFVQLDGKLPRSSGWGPGPGGIKAKIFNPQDYAFVDDFASIKGRLVGKGNIDRFDYWLTEFEYMRSMAKVSDANFRLRAVMKAIEKEDDIESKKKIAYDEALPLRQELVKNWGEMITYKLSTVSTTGGIGDIINLEEENRLHQPFLEFADSTLENILGKSLPQIPQDYRGPDRIIVPAIRTSLKPNEDFSLKVLIPTQGTVQKATLNWRPMGLGKWQKKHLKHVNRAVYNVIIPAEEIRDDFEYSIQVEFSTGKELYFPATAPQINQTVIISR